MQKSRLFVIVFVLLAGVFSVRAAGSSPSAPEALPAPIPGAPLPTLQVTPNHGLPGAALVATGHGVSPYPGVRLVWLDDETTATLQVVNLDGSGNYRATLLIPKTLPPGPGKVCGSVTGASQAAFQCVNITIDTPAPGSVSGSIPTSSQASPAAPADINASLKLYDRQGNVVASAPVQSNGSYSLSNVPPGVYAAGVTGSVPVLVQNGTVVVQSGQTATFNPVPFSQCTKGSVVAVRLSPTGAPTSTFDFGSYVNYWPYTEAGPKVDYEVDMQVLNGATLGLMVVRYDTNVGGSAIYTTVNAPASGTTYTLSRWLADVDVGIRHFSFEPGVSGGPTGCAVHFGTTRVHVIEHPMQNNALQGYVDRRVTDLVWDGSQYVFDVKVHSSYGGYDFLIPIFNINGERKLPVTFPSPPPVLDYIGPQENIIGGAALNAVGTLDLDGNVSLNLLRMRSRSSPMNLASVINGLAPLIPEGSSLPLSSPASPLERGIPIFHPEDIGTDLVEQLRELRYDIPPETLFDFSERIPVYEGVLFSAAGLVNLRISIVLGINGDMIYQGTIRPLAPKVSALAETNLRPSLDVEVILDALFGVASAGGTAHTEAEVRLPIEMDSDDSRFIWMPEPCFGITTTFYFWVRASIGFASASWNNDPITLLDYHEGSCQNNLRRAEMVDQPQDPPRLLAAPEVTSGPGGRLLAVYVEDSAPAAANPAPKIMARFWNTASGQWGTATALTDGTRMVQDPAAAFYSTDGRAMVAWTQNPMSLAEEQAAGNDLNLILKRQEIYYATYNGSAWSAPVRLTNDELPDGQPALAGDAQGITLAWVQDTDGNLATRQDMRIAARHWDPGTSTWSTLALLNGWVSNAANYQVAADRLVVGSTSQRVLAWTVDNDGDQGTTGDRYIVVFDWDDMDEEWVKDASSSLPLRADSPQVTFIPGSADLYLAYLVRSNDASGSSSGLGNLGALQTARRNVGSAWGKFPVLDGQGNPVRAEHPRLDVGPDGKALVMVRRFGDPSTNAELGQIAYAPLMDTGQAFPPIYLTDKPQQNWQPALAINQDNLQAVFLNVGRDLPISTVNRLASSPLAASEPGVRPAVVFTPLTTDADALESAVILPGADPALDPVLQVSQLHADPGATVTITTTVTNLGNTTAAGVSVGLFSGLYPGGSLIEEIAVGSLDFNQSQAVAFDVTAGSGVQPMYARVTASSQNITTTNDLAAASLGQLPPPEHMYIQVNTTQSGSLQVAWQAPAVPGIAGFRVLRSAVSGGPYELVGETLNTLYTDLLLPGGQTYYYVAETFDAAGAVSPYSAEVTADLPFNLVYMPVTRK